MGHRQRAARRATKGATTMVAARRPQVAGGRGGQPERRQLLLTEQPHGLRRATLATRPDLGHGIRVPRPAASAGLDLAQPDRKLPAQLAQSDREPFLRRARAARPWLGQQPPAQRKELVGPRARAREAIEEVPHREKHAQSIRQRGPVRGPVPASRRSWASRAGDQWPDEITSDRPAGSRRSWSAERPSSRRGCRASCRRPRRHASKLRGTWKESGRGNGRRVLSRRLGAAPRAPAGRIGAFGLECGPEV